VKESERNSTRNSLIRFYALEILVLLKTSCINYLIS